MNDTFEGVRVESVSAEMCDLWRQPCTGNALSCSVDDMHGLTAWQRLYTKNNPQTVARASHPVWETDIF